MSSTTLQRKRYTESLKERELSGAAPKIKTLDKAIVTWERLSEDSPFAVLESPTFEIREERVKVIASINSEGMVFIKGGRVERLGTYNCKGTITTVQGDNILVDWGFTSSWVQRYELYPLDAHDRPYISKKDQEIDASDLLAMAKRARRSMGFDLDAKLDRSPKQTELF